MSFFWSLPATRFLAAKANTLSSYVPPPPREAEEPPRKILLVHAHPLAGSFSSAVAAAVEAGATDGGHTLRRISLYGEGGRNWDPVMSPRERSVYKDSVAGKSRLCEDVRSSLDDLYWCDTLVFVYPTWWFNVPVSLSSSTSCDSARFSFIFPSCHPSI